MLFETFELGPMETNCHLLVNDDGEAVVIDPGEEPGVVVDFLRDQGYAVAAVLLTHLHHDHVLGAGRLADEFQAPVYGSDMDLFLLERMDAPIETTPLFDPEEPDDEADLKRPFDLEDAEDEMEVAGWLVKVLETPGHTPGSLCYHFPDLGMVFTGDLIMESNVGRSDLEGGDPSALMESVENVIFNLDDDTVIHPGHGPSTSVGKEKENNPFFQD